MEVIYNSIMLENKPVLFIVCTVLFIVMATIPFIIAKKILKK